MKKYKSKVSYGLIAFIALVLGGVFVLMLSIKSFVGMLIVLLIAGFIVHLFSTTVYIVLDGILKIKSGFFFNRSININNIKSIAETNDIGSAPANSLDRLEIRYNKYDCVIVSPKQKSEFIDQLKEINPGILVKLKKN